MKKLLLIVITLTFVFTLSGCDWFYSPRTDTSVSTPFYDIYGEDNDQDVYITFYDRAEVPYIDIKDFLDISENLIDSNEMVYTSSSTGFTVSYYEDTFETDLSLTFELNSQTLTANHFEFFTHQYNVDSYLPDYYYLTNYYDLTTYQLTDEVTLELDPYHLDIKEEDGDYLIPLALANLLFRDYGYGIYYTGEELYSMYFDSDFSTDMLDPYYYSAEVPEELMRHTFEYLAFYFDYFYGLREQEESLYYHELIMSEYLPQLNGDTMQYFQVVDYMLTDFNDLHLYLNFEGYYGESYDYDYEDYTFSGRWLTEENKAEQLESYCEENYSRVLSDEITLLAINSFDEYSSNVFAYEKDLYISETTDTVVIDLTCNGGGFIAEYMDIIPYFTDDIFTIFLENFEYGGLYTYTFDSNINALPQDIYVRTSGLTYSSANVFAKFLQDNDLATIIGESPNGGSSFLDTLYAPGGMMIVAPTLLHDTNVNHEYYEYGFEVDIPLYTYEDTVLISLIMNNN